MTDLVRIESCDAEHDVLCTSEGPSRPRNATRRIIALGRLVAAVVLCAAALGWVVGFGPGSDVRLSDHPISSPLKTVFSGPQPKGICVRRQDNWDCVSVEVTEALAHPG
jgi:hypothetical protein